MTDLKIDVAEWCEEHLKRCKVGDRNVDAECPWCERWGSFRVSRETGQYNCYKCSDQYDRGSKDRKGDEDRSVGFFPRLVARVEGISIREACSKCFDQARSIWQKRSEREARPERRVWNPPPAGIAIYDEDRERRWMVPRYLKDRGLSREVLREFDVRYATDGPCAGRAIIPIRSPAGTSWTARMMGPGDPRYLNPSDSGHGRLLLGWEQLPASGPILAPVEGPMDCMRNWMHGIPSLALLGKSMSEAQEAAIRSLRKRFPCLAIMLDDEERSMQWRIAERLCDAFEIRICKLGKDEGGSSLDPGAATSEQAWSSIDRGERYVGKRSAVSERAEAVRAALGIRRVAPRALEL